MGASSGNNSSGKQQFAHPGCAEEMAATAVPANEIPRLPETSQPKFR